MQFFVMKSGLEVFDTCRAYGLAQLICSAAGDDHSVTIVDMGGAFSITLPVNLQLPNLSRSDSWRALFTENNWQFIFLTYKAAWSRQREQIRQALQKRLGDILSTAAESGLVADFTGNATLPGPLDPIAFKGLKGARADDYVEYQTSADEENWALGCLGAAVAQQYKAQRVGGKKWEYYVTLPVPAALSFRVFLEVRELARKESLSYVGVRNAAAHSAVLIADAVREKAQGNPAFPATFNKVLYFSMFRSGQQFKPASGGTAAIASLIRYALCDPADAYEMFQTWRYLFRRGSTRGSEDLAEAITELVLAPSTESYYRHARVFSRYIANRQKGVKHEHLYSERGLTTVFKYVERP
jgi:hypothetical protein